jgi:hypothetical protein
MEKSAKMMTRKTIIYVEEISDTDKDTINKSFKQFNMSDNEGEAVHLPKVLDADGKAPPEILLSDMQGPSVAVPKRKVAPLNRGPKALAHGDDMKTIDQSLLYKTLRPMFRSMEACGLFFISRKTSHQQGLAGLIRNCTMMQAYCSFILIILIINFLRTLPALSSLSSFDNVFFFKLLMILHCNSALHVRRTERPHCSLHGYLN